jgi:UDP-2,3-diacylglucosamine pyrophosphatase LpxH
VAALGYYLEEGHRLYVLGDVEELWENSPDEPLEAYADALGLEAEFHRQGRYERFWGNHDDYWGHPGQVEKRLWRYYPELRVREALKLRVRSGDETVGLLFLVHGHQGTVESQRFAWFSKLVVRYFWRPLQRRFGFSATTPATDWELRARHNQALFAWARSHPQRPVLIAGHTHKPVFGTSRPPKPGHRPLSDVQAELAAAQAKSPVDRDEVARLRAELGWIEAIERSTEPAPIPIEPPCYFNTGCCSFPDGDVTGIEIADGRIRLVRWPDNEGNALPEILVEDDLREIFAKLGGPV